MAKTRHFRKGDRVRFTLGMRPVEGRVAEDRGPIGINGRRLYLVQFGTGGGDADAPRPPSQIELPAEELEAVPETAAVN